MLVLAVTWKSVEDMDSSASVLFHMSVHVVLASKIKEVKMLILLRPGLGNPSVSLLMLSLFQSQSQI